MRIATVWNSICRTGSPDLSHPQELDEIQGEIDVIEGINLQKRNVVSLHTCGECQFTGIGPSNPRSNCNS